MKTKRGLFALSETAKWILALVGLILIVYFIYFLRERILTFADVLLRFLGK